MANDRTTDLAQLREGADFTWGRLVRLVDLGQVTIGEFKAWASKGGLVDVGGRTERRSSFHVWVNGKDDSVSERTIERAALWGVLRAGGLDWNSTSGAMQLLGRSLKV